MRCSIESALIERAGRPVLSDRRGEFVERGDNSQVLMPGVGAEFSLDPSADGDVIDLDATLD